MSVNLQSVQTRLIGAFAAIIALSLIGVVVGVFAFSTAGQSLRSVVEQTAPRSVAAQGLSASVNSLTGELAAFGRARENADVRESAARMGELMSQADTYIDTLRRSGEAPATIARLTEEVNRFRETISNAEGEVAGKLETIGAREAQMNAALRERSEASAAFEEALDTISDPADIESVLRANMALNLAVARYAELSVARTAEEIAFIRDEFDYAVDEVTINLAILGPLVTEAMSSPSQSMIARAEGERGMFALRQTELTRSQSVNEIISQARTIDMELRQLVQTTIARSQAVQDEFGQSGLAAIAMGRTLLVVMAIAALIIGVLITWLYVSRNMLRRLAEMNEAMQSLAAGEIGEAMQDDGADELSSMARSVNVFRENAIERERLASQSEAEQAARESRSKAIEELIGRFESVSASALTSVQNAASDLEQSASALDQSSRQASETTAAVNTSSARAAENVDTVAAAAEEMTGSIAEIVHQIARSNDIARDASERVESTNADVNELNDAATRIGDIVRLINDIAEQTNLLALNATIEAARAGEAGKGFAVVASEVKTLAEQTGNATSNISEQVNGIQGATSKAVTAIASIGEVISEMTNISSAIAAAMEEQRAAASEITRAAHEASEGTRQVAGSISEVDSAAAETGQCAAQVNSASTTLSGEADGLKRAVGEFLTGVRSA